MREYVRKPLFNALVKGLKGEPRFIQAVVGPRQVGKTTTVMQLYDKWNGPKIYNTADMPNTPTNEWIIEQWNQCRVLCKERKRETLLALDEVQKIPRWSEVVKKMFDGDKIAKRRIRVVLLGSSSLLMQKGLTESLAGRFEVHRHNHWSFSECKEYFNVRIDEYLYFGGYPAAIPLRKDKLRWERYIRDSLIETVLSKDVLLMYPITKPALLRQLFGLCMFHPAEIVSYQKMIGQLQDAGNTTTVADYLRVMSNAFFIAPLEKYSGSIIRQRGSTPKIIVLDNSLVSAITGQGFKETLRDGTFWGRMVENAVGAKLYSLVQEKGGELFYWRDRDDEVDFVVKHGRRIMAIEVKLGLKGKARASLHKFENQYENTEKFVIYNPKLNRTNGKEDENITGNNVEYVTLDEYFTDPKKCLKM